MFVCQKQWRLCGHKESVKDVAKKSIRVGRTDFRATKKMRLKEFTVGEFFCQMPKHESKKKKACTGVAVPVLQNTVIDFCLGFIAKGSVVTSNGSRREKEAERERENVKENAKMYANDLKKRVLGPETAKVGWKTNKRD